MANTSIFQREQLLERDPSLFIHSSKRRIQKPNVFLSCALALTFSASLLGATVGRLVGMDQFPTWFQASCFALLIALTVFNKKLFHISKLSALQMAAIYLILAFTAAQAIYWLGSRNVYGASLNKSLGMFLTFSAAILASRIFRRQDWMLGLKIFAFVELGSIFLLRFSNLDLGFNNNNIGMRITVAGLVLFALLQNKFARYGILGVSVGLAFTLQCRTSVVAAAGALSFLLLENYSRRSRILYVLLTISSLCFVFALLPTLHSIFTNALVAMLGSDNIFAQFLLSDKSAVDIKNNLFDRIQVWDHAWTNATRSLVFGHGIGSERNVLGEVRSHNAYISLIIEGGFVFLCCWILFYVPFLLKLFDRKWVATSRKEELNTVALLLLWYMLLSGIMESSGFGSISTPNNLIFMFLSLYLLADNSREA